MFNPKPGMSSIFCTVHGDGSARSSYNRRHGNAPPPAFISDNLTLKSYIRLKLILFPDPAVGFVWRFHYFVVVRPHDCKLSAQTEDWRARR